MLILNTRSGNPVAVVACLAVSSAEREKQKTKRVKWAECVCVSKKSVSAKGGTGTVLRLSFAM